MTQYMWLPPAHPAPAPFFRPVPIPASPPAQFGVYAPHDVKLKDNPKRAARGAVPRAQQNRISAQRVRDRQKNYERQLEETAARLEQQNAQLMAEISTIKKSLGIEPDAFDAPTPPHPLSPISDTTFTSDDSETWEDALDTFPSENQSPLSLSSADTDYESMVVSSPASTCDSGVSTPSRPGSPAQDNVAAEEAPVEQTFALDLSAFDPSTFDFNALWAGVSSPRDGSSEHSCESAALASPLQQEALMGLVFLLMTLMSWISRSSTQTTSTGSKSVFESMASLLSEVRVPPSGLAPWLQQAQKIAAHHGGSGFNHPPPPKKVDLICA
eukprot:comp22219_c0_seq2/m.32725 comp22219_c0_seq2/g.32725  ORF comp22219_c0_seq2/g.32725 comp22219_c0_seq2/m.32725 type:complete len:327 (-) comp22219_c0_seq2:174-1154(-)